MVEFVFILPILLLLFAGVIEISRLMATHTLVNSASREAARFAATAGDSGPGTRDHFLDCDRIRQAALRISQPLVGVDPTDIEIEYDSGPGTSLLTPSGCPPPIDQVGLGTRVIVTVSAEFQPMVPLVPLGSVSVSSQTSRTLLTDIDPKP
ncbi:MAG: TadE/TadG family type IV pilus assembly protein [Anaerolineales bacterium]